MTDSLILIDQSETIKIEIKSIEEVITDKPVCNVITARSYNIIANNLHCSTHCEGDGGDLLFNITSFFYNYVSEKSVKIAYSLHKKFKNL